jgi:hypothetical protein
MSWLRRVCLLVVLVLIAISPLFAATGEGQAPRNMRGKTQRPGGASPAPTTEMEKRAAEARHSSITEISSRLLAGAGG